MICFTKIDSVFDETKKRIEDMKTDEDVILISALTGEHLKELKDMLWSKLETIKEEHEQ